MTMKYSEIELLKKQAAILEEKLDLSSEIEKKIRSFEEEVEFYYRKDITGIRDMQQMSAGDSRLYAMLEEEYALIEEEKKKYGQFADEYRENIRRDKIRREDLLKEIREAKEKEKWETE
jgi:hypothetical protein